MMKEKFLRGEYDRIIASGEFMYSAWRDNFEVFCNDLWDMTPNYRSHRFVAMVDKSLGFSPGNIEFHFEQPRERNVLRKQKPKVKTQKTTKKTVRAVPKDQRKALEAAAREARRKQLAEEFKRWEQRRSVSSSG